MANSPVSRKMDLSSGHSVFPPRRAALASPNVFVNGSPCLNIGTIMELHCLPMMPDPESCHTGIIVQASRGQVFVNGTRIGVIRSKIICGKEPFLIDYDSWDNNKDIPLDESKYDEYIRTGSNNVFAPSVP